MKGWTTLHFAANYGCEGIVRALLAAGEPLHKRTKGGDTALQLATDDLTCRILTAEPARRAVLALWGVYRFRKSALSVFPKDVMRLVCEALWVMRADPEWQ
jgi:hypothetical protein